MKRFTATEKWEKPWFQDLPPRIKCLWLYICDKCDCAGVWEMNWKAATFFIGEDVSALDLKAFGERVAIFDGEKLLVRQFVDFQCGKLSTDCKAHNPIFRTIAKHSLSKGYAKAIKSLKEKEKEKEGEEEGGMQGGDGTTEPPQSGFEQFWKAYPNKVGKGKAEESWKKLKCDSILERILNAVESAKGSRRWTDDGGQYIPNPATWLNQKRWDDELEPAHRERNSNHIPDPV